MGAAVALVLLMLVLANGPVSAAERAYLGMQPQEIPAQAMAALGIDAPSGIMIRDVGRDTAAADAGVRRGDMLLSLDGTDITSLVQLISVAQSLKPGSKVNLSVLRVGETLELSMVVGAWPEARDVKKNYVGQIPALGLTMTALPPKVREQFSVRWDSEGLLVSLVDPSKGISEIIKRGDIIVQVNQQRVWLPDQAIRIYQAAKDSGKRQVLLLLERTDGYILVMLPVR
jgi:serine protease Do